MAKSIKDGLSVFDKFKSINPSIEHAGLSSGEIAELHESGIDLSKLRPATGGRQRLLSDEQELSIVKLVKSGFSKPSVAKTFGIHTNTVRAIVGRHNTSPSEA